MKKRVLYLATIGVPLVVMMGNSALAQPAGGGAGILCDAWAIGPAASTSTIVVTGVANQHINICGWHASTSGSTSATIVFSYTSVAAACTTTLTALTHTMDITPNKGADDHNVYASISTPAGMTLCATPSTTVVKYIIYYSQD